MSLTRALIPVIALLGWPPCAVALDPGAAVKVAPLLKSTTSWNGQPLTYPGGQAEATGLLVEIAPGGETGWHEHAVPSFALLLEEVIAKQGRLDHRERATLGIFYQSYAQLLQGASRARLTECEWRLARLAQTQQPVLVMLAVAVQRTAPKPGGVPKPQ